MLLLLLWYFYSKFIDYYNFSFKMRVSLSMPCFSFYERFKRSLNSFEFSWIFIWRFSLICFSSASRFISYPTFPLSSGRRSINTAFFNKGLTHMRYWTRFRNCMFYHLLIKFLKLKYFRFLISNSYYFYHMIRGHGYPNRWFDCFLNQGFFIWHISVQFWESLFSLADCP